MMMAAPRESHRTMDPRSRKLAVFGPLVPIRMDGTRRIILIIKYFFFIIKIAVDIYIYYIVNGG